MTAGIPVRQPIKAALPFQSPRGAILVGTEPGVQNVGQCSWDAWFYSARHRPHSWPANGRLITGSSIDSCGLEGLNELAPLQCNDVLADRPRGNIICSVGTSSRHLLAAVYLQYVHDKTYCS